MLPACANPAEVTAAIAALDAKHAPPSIHTRATRIALALRGAAKALEEISDALEIGGPGDVTAGR